ncbi:putative Fatty acid oxidation complex subunit alpha [Includes: Enoyl-CoA hydratase/3-hydroxybutyryl-CoA epimerase; 3-hydroxyacyl-CoA dehydrogenase] [Nitrospira japonica]|uniref:enoyl-CoA hydratase n=1 Tax=Nitrospira japonica TaxID=1325564 RepID=A0A1W1I763_9BACT|nr:3-hydroxyacyl-CoA dehydrogenase NAD-binding domain-containing protein [Nitrospira japonica]SLM48761.1 putative Fatty acid oxidation complex subunit alpha [Includes: Enoyl-CoA hydratase/3-hydroxybutyryl-CoA epimerase; 3-hydroxyacyl-CoA dehydrogenase] [Nitrospira japonica]
MANDPIGTIEGPGGLRHFKTAVLEDGTLLAGFDYQGKAVNVLNVDSMAEWRQLVQWAEGASAVTGVVLLSLKHGNFCAGADLEEMHDAQRRKSFQELDRLVVDAHTVFDAMGRSRKPFVAAVEGVCLGGGLELALACHARVASTHERTGLALPEVRLGILPGFGGTQRLPRLIGLVPALDMITTGRTVFPRQALRMGLINAMVTSIPSRVRRLDEIQQETLIQAALAQVRRLRGATDRRSSLPLSRWLPGAPLIRSLVCRFARRQVLKRVRHFYPAPVRAIDAVERGLGMDLLEASLTVEKPLLIELMASSVSTHLVGLFLAGEAVKRKAATAAQGVTRLGVLGAGLMGSQIAGQLADRGYSVVLRDLAPDILAAAAGRIHKALAAQVRKRIILPSELRYRSLRIAPTTRMSDVSSAGLVIEAVSEKLEVKRAVLAEFELEAPSNAIFATNTSSYTLADIAVNAICPDRCVGLHFFNPVAKMQLVEVVRAPFTSEWALAEACTVAKRLGKFPLLVRDGPGFLVNRILSRYLAEAVILVGEGVPIQRIDRIAQDFGMAVDSGHPMGPLELIDLIGLPVAIHVLASLTVLGHRIESREALLRGLLGEGGVPLPFWKSGKENPEAVEAIREHRRAFGAEPASLSDEVLHRRLFLPMVDEAVRCLTDNIVEQPQEVDLALTYGIGFPGFRGGLLTWARDTMTPRALAGELEALAQRYGKRFEPCPGLAAGEW